MEECEEKQKGKKSDAWMGVFGMRVEGCREEKENKRETLLVGKWSR